MLEVPQTINNSEHFVGAWYYIASWHHSVCGYNRQLDVHNWFPALTGLPPRATPKASVLTFNYSYSLAKLTNAKQGAEVTKCLICSNAFYSFSVYYHYTSLHIKCKSMVPTSQQTDIKNGGRSSQSPKRNTLMRQFLVLANHSMPLFSRVLCATTFSSIKCPKKVTKLQKN